MVQLEVQDEHFVVSLVVGFFEIFIDTPDDSCSAFISMCYDHVYSV